ncbi:MAG: hypothetical protein ACFE8E_09130 [Candidatus Hodarchaeota archaeon]
MMSTGAGDSDQILNLKDLFDDSEINYSVESELAEFKEKSKIDNFNLLQEIQTILQKCAHLNPRQRLMYCESQRYFMKQYLREVNKSK